MELRPWMVLIPAEWPAQDRGPKPKVPRRAVASDGEEAENVKINCNNELALGHICLRITFLHTSSVRCPFIYRSANFAGMRRAHSGLPGSHEPGNPFPSHTRG
jgi:hypothetical protein